jgi:hypothetical protein
MSVVSIGQSQATPTQTAPKTAGGGENGVRAVSAVPSTRSSGRVTPVTAAQPLNSSGRGQRVNILT